MGSGGFSMGGALAGYALRRSRDHHRRERVTTLLTPRAAVEGRAQPAARRANPSRTSGPRDKTTPHRTAARHVK